MRIRSLVAAAAGLALAAAAGLVITLGGARAQDAGPDLTGTWTGKTAYKFFPLAPEERPNRGVVVTTLELLQSGPDLSGTLMVETEDGTEVFSLTGKFGEGHFWLANQDPAAHMLVGGHLKGKAGTKIVGSGVLGDPQGLNELRLNLKRSVE